MKIKFFIILAVSFFFSIYALPVDRNKAEIIAKNWMNGKSGKINYDAVSGYINIGNALHVFNFKNGGFTVIAADDGSIPVLGYSFSGKFDNSPEKSNINFWTDLYVKAIQEIRSEKLGNEITLPAWEKILRNEIPRSGDKAVLPLLTSTWNQSPIYNNYCPLDGGSLSVVGCVATAMAQIMNYHQYPSVGKSSSSYSVLGQTLAVDYYLSRYNWDLMPDALTSGSSQAEIHEVAQISYHAGVAVEMDYGADGSGAYSDDVPYALETYFKYNQSAAYVSRSGFTLTAWETLIKGQIDINRPVYYSGQGDAGGHAFVCDGYDDANLFHFNWGWGGSSDGYYSLTNLNPGGMTFNDYQAIVKDIVPKTVEVVLADPIDDIMTFDTTYQIDLSDHFSPTGGADLTFSLDPSSEMNGMEYNLTDGILTLNKLESGTSHLVVVCTTRYDNTFDEFYFKFSDNDVLAGYGNSYDFNSSAYLDAGNSEVLNSMEKITFSTWIKLNSVGREHGIASKSLSSNTGWSFMVQSNNKLKFTVKTQDAITRNIYSIQALQANKWYHLDVMYDGKDLMIYINGELDNIKTTYPTASNILHDAGNSILLGYSNGLYLDGQLDENILWNQPISVMQVRDIMGKRPELPNSSIVAFWTFDEGFYDQTYDMTGINDGTFINNDVSNWQDSQAPLYFFMGTNAVLNGILLGNYDETAVYNITRDPLLGSIEILYPHSGDFTYTSNTDATGIDTLKYTITYGKSVTAEKTVFISVKESNGIDDIAAPKTFDLAQNYPNPFNPVTQIKFALAKSSDVKLSVYNISGQLVSQLAGGVKQAGFHTINFDGSKFNSGVYYYSLEVDGKTMTKKMVLAK